MGKYRIVEDTFPNGKIMYHAQRKFLFWWFDYKLPTIYRGTLYYSMSKLYHTYQDIEEILYILHKIKPKSVVVTTYN